jgi:hypothetical protein
MKAIVSTKYGPPYVLYFKESKKPALKDAQVLKTNNEIERLKLAKSNLRNDLIDRVIMSRVYQVMKGRVDKDIVLIRDKLSELQHEVSPFNIYIQKEVPTLESLLEYYRMSEFLKII